MKILNPVDISIDTCMDADDLGQRLVDCIRAIDSSHTVVNVVKVHVGDGLPLYNFNDILKNSIVGPLTEMGATNCIFVPIKRGYIEDVTIDHVEVIKDEANS